jgi:hypothetical protein
MDPFEISPELLNRLHHAQIFASRAVVAALQVEAGDALAEYEMCRHVNDMKAALDPVIDHLKPVVELARVIAHETPQKWRHTRDGQLALEWVQRAQRVLALATACAKLRLKLPSPLDVARHVQRTCMPFVEGLPPLPTSLDALAEEIAAEEMDHFEEMTARLRSEGRLSEGGWA